MAAPQNPIYALKQEFIFIDALGSWNDAWPVNEPRTECLYNPLPEVNLSRIALLEKYADTWRRRAKDFRGNALRKSMLNTILEHIDDVIEAQKEIRRGAATACN